MRPVDEDVKVVYQWVVARPATYLIIACELKQVIGPKYDLLI